MDVFGLLGTGLSLRSGVWAAGKLLNASHVIDLATEVDHLWRDQSIIDHRIPMYDRRTWGSLPRFRLFDDNTDRKSNGRTTQYLSGGIGSATEHAH